MYSLQRRIQRQWEFDKAGNALQKREIKELMNILDFLGQLALQLIKDYNDVMENIDHCND